MIIKGTTSEINRLKGMARGLEALLSDLSLRVDPKLLQILTIAMINIRDITDTMAKAEIETCNNGEESAA